MTKFDPVAGLVGLLGTFIALGIVTLPVDQYNTQQTALLLLLASQTKALSLEFTFAEKIEVSTGWVLPLIALGAVIIVGTVRCVAILLGA